ncbi:PadR family transcriptional regulator [Kribbella deserti]|uniref:PadR family transcriptional regulator n=1 Tax=Kribbella deserti TaxID=1926257 RepID=A0ABV6QTD5_9ACTN
MTGSAQTVGWPWQQLARDCSLVAELKKEWLAMSGRRGHGAHPFGGPWDMFGGPAGWAGGPPGWAGGPRGWRGQKARRGDVRAAILAVLAEQPMNGYQIIQEVAERSGGAWKPSPGSIYPTLQQLEDEGLVTADAGPGRRTFTLTDEGRAYVAEHADEVRAPWEAMTAPADDDNGLKPLLGQVGTALWQIHASGTPDQQARARRALADLRRTLFGILADDDDQEQDRS